jgi:hypothetical protein
MGRGKSNLEEAMNGMTERVVAMSKRNAARTAMALWMAGGAAAGLLAQGSVITVRPKMQTTAAQGKFYCNVKALTPEERARHKQLGDKLAAERRKIVETAKGYEFQFSPKTVSLAELAEWVAAESKCCPFFDFHIDLEEEGGLLCLRLTGGEGTKAFIRAEFHVE